MGMIIIVYVQGKMVAVVEKSGKFFLAINLTDVGK
jgi:hypothetical protein